MTPPFIRSPYNYDVKEASEAVGISDGGASLTVQSMSEDADINVLMRRYGILGKFPENPFVPTYQDFSGITDFRSALHAIQDASERFYLYPADFRARFENNPQLFLDFCENPVNIPEMRKLGLFKQEVSNGSGGSGVSGVGRSSAGVGASAGGSVSSDKAAAGGGDAVAGQSAQPRSV